MPKKKGWLGLRMTPFFGVKKRKKRGYCTKKMYFKKFVEK